MLACLIETKTRRNTLRTFSGHERTFCISLNIEMPIYRLGPQSWFTSMKALAPSRSQVTVPAREGAAGESRKPRKITTSSIQDTVLQFCSKARYVLGLLSIILGSRGGEPADNWSQFHSLTRLVIHCEFRLLCQKFFCFTEPPSLYDLTCRSVKRTPSVIVTSSGTERIERIRSADLDGDL